VLSWGALLVIGGVAGVVNAVVGGGSMLTVPALISIGLFTEPDAVGSNRFVLVFMTLTSSYQYWRHDKLHGASLKRLLPGLIPGAFVGAMVAGRVDERVLRLTIGVLTFLLLSLLYVEPERGEEERPPVSGAWTGPVILVVSGVLGFYGGFYGAGVSTLLCFTMIYFMGRTMIQGIGTAQVLTCVISVAASVRFAMDGHIRYMQVLPLGIGLVAGAYAGPYVAVTMGNRWIKGAFSVLVSIAGVNLLVPDSWTEGVGEWLG